MIRILSSELTIANQFLKELRDVNIQKDRMRFRRNMERLGEIFAYEISKTLDYAVDVVETPLGTAKVKTPQDDLILAAVLRAGLPLHNGFLNYYDHADNAFISAYRAHNEDGAFEIRLQYITCPNIDEKVVIVIDPMIATGASIEKTLNCLFEIGKPKKVHVVGAIASKSGLNRIKRLFPDVDLWLGAVDEELTAKLFIVPGLGDAGDLSYGAKIQD